MAEARMKTPSSTRVAEALQPVILQTIRRACRSPKRSPVRDHRVLSVEIVSVLWMSALICGPPTPRDRGVARHRWLQHPVDPYPRPSAAYCPSCAASCPFSIVAPVARPYLSPSQSGPFSQWSLVLPTFSTSPAIAATCLPWFSNSRYPPVYPSPPSSRSSVRS